MVKHRLPIGLQSFRKLREKDCYYVDKTILISQMIDEGEHYFLSRPRRFGKSLLLDTIDELFSCNEELFIGLDIHDEWDWTNPHPVLRLSFDAKYSEPEDLAKNILSQIAAVERNIGFKPFPEDLTGPDRLRSLLSTLHRKTGRQVVVLVDEYDKPILDVLDDPELAKSNRDYLRGFYGVIKGCAEHVRFVFVTGVSMFSKVSLFSGMNNLTDISLEPGYATLCGYTDHDLETVFAPELEGLDRDEIRHWYNGYNWLGDQKVYNPYDVLLLFRKRKFQAHWFQTGTPTMLYRKIMNERVNPMELENFETDERLISKFDIDDIDLRALMFQSGYLTITGESSRGSRQLFRLDYPNHEVRESMVRGLLEYTTRRSLDAERQGEKLVELLVANDFNGFKEELHAYLAGIPHQWYDNSPVEEYEAYYASMLYMVFRAISVDLTVEDASSHGRADMVIREGDQVFVIEFKMAENPAGVESAIEDAMKQMKARGYADKYQDRNEPIHLVAVIFESEKRNVLQVKSELG